MHHCILTESRIDLFCTAKATSMLLRHAARAVSRTRVSCTVRHLAAAADTVTVSVHEAQSTTAQALRMIGWDDEAADVQAEIMTAAELCGNNQGLVKMFNPSLMAPQPGAGKPVVERETATSAAINANQAPGMLAAVTASDLAADKALENNVAVVSAYNTSTSSGQLAFYAERQAKKGLVCLALANSPEFVAPSAGASSVFGTNPLAVAVPRKGQSPFSFDMATSAVALFGVLTAKATGAPLAEGVAYDASGKVTTDAGAVLDGGAIATFGGHKGAGLALCVELLAGALSGGAVVGQEVKKEAKNWGHLFLCVKPDALVDDYDAKAAAVCKAVKDAGARVPGDRSAAEAAARVKADALPIPTKIWESITRTAEHGLAE